MGFLAMRIRRGRQSFVFYLIEGCKSTEETNLRTENTKYISLLPRFVPIRLPALVPPACAPPATRPLNSSRQQRRTSSGEKHFQHIRSLTLRYLVFLPGGPASCPLPYLRPLLLGDLPLEMHKRSLERHRACLGPVQVAGSFYPGDVWLLRGDLGPFAGPLVTGDSLVCRAPPDLDDDVWPSPPKVCILAWSAYLWPGSGSSEAFIPASVYIGT